MTQAELKKTIIALGFQHFAPACQTWRDAFVYQFDNQVLVVLFRSRGIDLRYYDNFNNEIFLNQDNKLALTKGTIARASYGEVNFNIHQRALVTATDFTLEKVNHELFPQYQLSPAQLKYA